jgi:radical SAM protein with 4Fe4S-binding SPASM domain
MAYFFTDLLRFRNVGRRCDTRMRHDEVYLLSIAFLRRQPLHRGQPTVSHLSRVTCLEQEVGMKDQCTEYALGTFAGMEVPLRPQFVAPLYVAWEVTLRCNARCLHCYSEAAPGLRDPLELSTDEALGVIDQLAESGLLVLAFSGGEPLLRRDIFQLIDRAMDRGLVVQVATNGAVITKRVAARLQQSGVRGVTVSLDGASAATHDHFRQFPGLFDRTLRAIQLLAEHELRVVVSFTPTTLNYREGRDVVALAYALGAQAANLSEFVPAGRGTRDLCLPPETLRDVILDWIAMQREYAGQMQIIWHDCRVALLVPPEERDLYSGCGAGKLTARIKVDGTVTPCVFLPNPAGNLRRTPFKEIWANSPLMRTFRDRDSIRVGNCGSCHFKHVCGGCRAVSMSYYGDPMRGDPSCWVVPESPVAMPTYIPLAAVPTAALKGGGAC